MFLNSVSPLIILVIILLVAGTIALIAFFIHRFLNPKLKDETEHNEEKIVEEELNRVLEPVDDEDLAKSIADYKEKDD